jgi:glutamate-1-semialdehyde 2,1-aminomutase
MVNSGKEATMMLCGCCGYTKRDKVIKFEGCYHGHHDSFLIQAGSGALTLSTPNSPGVTASTTQDTILAQFNNFESVHNAFRAYGDQIAAIIVEPIPGNMGVVIPEIKFLQQLREICDIYGALLIFDEVMTGFRVAKGGAQELYSIVPDITTLGKIIGGGLPVGAYGANKNMDGFPFTPRPFDQHNIIPTPYNDAVCFLALIPKNETCIKKFNKTAMLKRSRINQKTNLR